jgi:hypothetical protein
MMIGLAEELDEAFLLHDFLLDLSSADVIDVIEVIELIFIMVAQVRAMRSGQIRRGDIEEGGAHIS